MRRVRSAQGVGVREVDGRGHERFASRVRRTTERAAQMLHGADGIATPARIAHLYGVARLAVAETRVADARITGVAARRNVLLADVALRRAVEQRCESVV